jgi:uncharacterized membrane protein YdbT with pleckstrin-like domain
VSTLALASGALTTALIAVSETTREAVRAGLVAGVVVTFLLAAVLAFSPVGRALVPDDVVFLSVAVPTVAVVVVGVVGTPVALLVRFGLWTPLVLWNYAQTSSTGSTNARMRPRTVTTAPIPTSRIV